MQIQTSGNPILPGKGVCDPHVRVYGDTAYLYATHDADSRSTDFVMHDWWIYSSKDLVDWNYECTIYPQQTYYGKSDPNCWAVDAIDRGGKYYLYFSRGPKEIGVLEADTPTGPWRDPLAKPLIADGLVPVEARDPGLFRDADGECYIVFGTWEYYIARLSSDMISLAEEPRKLQILDPEGPYGKGKTDDKPYLHSHGGLYYLSWGCYYAVSENLYGPYQCKGSVITEESIIPEYRYTHQDITYDRHGSFFCFKNRWFFICNEMGLTQNTYFRDSSIAEVFYTDTGDIEPLRFLKQGVRVD